MTRDHDAAALALAQDLIRCKSVTPRDEGALDVLEQTLRALGFVCHRLPFASPGELAVDNLYARHGTSAPNFCFAGHTDVVPTGELSDWTVDPFAGTIIDGALYGRGAADMKGAIACFVTAAARILTSRDGQLPGSISLLITGDEEGAAINGTIKVLEWMKSRGETLDACLVGEPTNPKRLGEMAKIGRRGSLNGALTVRGTQGHVAYPQFADNPIPRLVKMLAAVSETALDEGTPHFQPSNFEITSIDVDNAAANVIPAMARAMFNVRFNDRHSSRDLVAWLRRIFDSVGGAYNLDITVSGEAFLTPPGPLSELVVEAVKETLGRTPDLSTSGGTSDARFIKDVCPVAEFGLISETMHKIDERTRLADLAALTDVYAAVLEGYFPV